MAGLNILFLEEQKADISVVENIFQKAEVDVNLIPVGDRNEFTKALSRKDIDLIIANHPRSGFDGMDAFTVLKEEGIEIPFILISGVDGEELAIETLKNGVSDYVLKSRMERLVPAVRRALLETKESTRIKRVENLHQKYDFIVNASKSMFTLIDSDYRYEAVNDAFCKAHDLIREQIIGRSLSELWGEETFKKFIKENCDASFSDNIVRYQSWFEVPSQGLRCFEVSFYPYKEKNSNVTHTVVDTTDITDRQKAHDALQESESRYRILFDHASESIVLEKNGIVSTCNKPTADFFAAEKSEITGHPIFSFSPEFQPDGRKSDEVAREYLLQCRDDEKLEFSWVFKRADGTRFDAEVSLTGFNFHGERFFQYFIHDITARTEAEENEKKLVRVIEQSDELILITDIEGHISYANPQFIEATGIDQDNLMGKNFQIIMESVFSDEQFLLIKSILQENKVWAGEIDLKTRLKKSLKVSVRASGIRNLAGDLTNYVILMRDITEESRVKEYLQQAQKMETIGTLAGGIAHDFNNILATIMGHADIAMLDLEKDHSAHEDLKQIMTASERAKALVNQILTFSREVDTRKEYVNLATLIQEVLNMLKASRPENITVFKKLDDECPVLQADPSQLHQVILNICTNAFYSMRENGGNLDVRLEEMALNKNIHKQFPDLEDGKYLRLTISDTGKGIPVSVKTRIFEPFFTTKPVGEGTGLGLSVVHGIVKKMKGAVSVKSMVGKGTVFTVMLPVNP